MARKAADAPRMTAEPAQLSPRQAAEPAVVRAAEKHGVPAEVVGGIVVWESEIDPQLLAEDLRAVHDRWVGKTAADPWDIAIAHHLSPDAAVAWAENGAPVYDPELRIPISEYVHRARAAW
jgi:hypothetical protein